MAKPPVFLERESYRRRRMVDAARLLPVLGVIILMVPVLWPVASQTQGTPLRVSSAGLYIFIAWLALIAISALISRRVSTTPPETSEPEQE